MISLPFPYQRFTYPGIDNPIYVGDIRLANEATMAGMAAMAGLGANEFWIISGLEYVNDTQPYYTAGYIYLNGLFYQVEQQFNEGNWLVAQSVVALTEPFDDGQNRFIYLHYRAQASAANPDPVNNTSGPQFIGPMDNYRRAIDYISDRVAFMLTKVNALKSAAFADIGLAAGNVASAQDPRLVYTAVQLDARFAQRINVIEKGTVSGAYVPANPGDPVNKAYSDATSGRRITSGITPLGDADLGGGTVHTISFGQTINVPYMVAWTLNSLSANPALDVFSQITIRAKTTTSFGIYLREQQNGVQNVTVDWIIWAM